MAVESPPIEKIVRTIVERFNPKRIVLSGSRARGDGDPGSDVDLFVEMESDKSPAERTIEVGRIFGLREWSMDLFVYTPEEAERRKRIRGTLASIVEAEGKVLYGRS